VKRQPFKDMCY